MSQKPMIEDMKVRNFLEKTKNDYIRCVKSFAAFLGRSPDQATPEKLRAFQVHQTETGVRPPTINGSVAALLLFDHTRPRERSSAPFRRQATVR
jgi:integrase/recombinase XerD